MQLEAAPHPFVRIFDSHKGILPSPTPPPCVSSGPSHLPPPQAPPTRACLSLQRAFGPSHPPHLFNLNSTSYFSLGESEQPKKSHRMCETWWESTGQRGSGAGKGLRFPAAPAPSGTPCSFPHPQCPSTYPRI